MKFRYQDKYIKSNISNLFAITSRFYLVNLTDEIFIIYLYQQGNFHLSNAPYNIYLDYLEFYKYFTMVIRNIAESEKMFSEDEDISDCFFHYLSFVCEDNYKRKFYREHPITGMKVSYSIDHTNFLKSMTIYLRLMKKIHLSYCVEIQTGKFTPRHYFPLPKQIDPLYKRVYVKEKEQRRDEIHTSL